jgi:hypothetical protein
MKNFDDKKFVEDLLNQHLEYVYFFADNPNTMWEIWKKLFEEVLNKHAPIQQKKISFIDSNIKSIFVVLNRVV